MSTLLLELFSEEIPATLQAPAAARLEKAVMQSLAACGVTGQVSQAFATPRRLALTVSGLPAHQPDHREERKGPRVDAPEKALQGFMRATGLTLDQCEKREDKKGAFYVGLIEKKGRPLPALIAEIMPGVIRDFHWPKSMRWGEGTLRWVRPLHSVLCVCDGKAVPFEVEGLVASDITQGHRFMGTGTIRVRDFEDYVTRLGEQKVLLDGAARAAHIEERARALAGEQGLELVEDPALLQEVTGLVEWPVVLMGAIDPDFMAIPGEVLRSTMRAHQKYFSLRDPRTGALAPYFIVVANLETQDGGAAIVRGNERVLRARFADARFLWEEDKKTSLHAQVGKLDGVVFHAQLGSLAQKAVRVSRLAGRLASITGADKAQAEEAGTLAKADLVSGMVGEFPELQGIMGAYYARHDGLAEPVAAAIAEHYRPQGPSDTLPEGPVAQAVSLADKLDSLVGFWRIGEKPTGSRDPYALRRAALGVIRIILENGLRARLLDVFAWAEDADRDTKTGESGAAIRADLLRFFWERVQVYLREKGMRHDWVDAVFTLPGQDDLVRSVRRVEALAVFLQTGDGDNLLAGYRRAVNILRAEEKKDGVSFDGKVTPSLLSDPHEQALYQAMCEAAQTAQEAIEAEDFGKVMEALAKSRAPVDAFLDKVTVNVPDPAVRANRLRLLAQMRTALSGVADFSKIEG